jgi:hypothetical protein
MAVAACGHELRPGVRFCTVCGRSVAEDGNPVSGPQRPVNLVSPPAVPVGGPSGVAAPSPSWMQPDPYAPTGDSPAYQVPGVEPGAYQAPPVPPGPYQAFPAGSAPRQPPHPAPSRWQAPHAAPGPGRRRSRRPLLLGVVAVLAAGAIAAGFFVARHFHDRHSGAAALKTSSPAAVGTPQAPAVTETPSSISAREQAAEGLAGLLTQSVKDRSAIVQAVSDVQQCGPNLNQDSQTFQTAATSRQNLLTQLANLSGRSALPSNMLAALTGAWQNSVKADQDFAQWSQDEVSRGCNQNDQSDPGAQAAVGPDDQATAGKQNFVSRWNPIATEYGLPAFQWNQL